MRKTYIEFIRIIACISIIIPHIETWNNYWFFIIRILGVPLFAMITGFFLLSREENYIQLLKRNLKKIVLPSFILIIILVIFDGYISNSTSITSCITNISLYKIYNAMKMALSLKFTFISSASSHLWYLKPYILFILFYPLIKLICNKNKKTTYVRIAVIFFLLLLYLINDLYDLSLIDKTVPINNSTIFIYFLLGYELYLYKDKYMNRDINPIIWSIILIVIGIILKYWYYIYGNKGYTTGCITIGCVVASIGNFIILARIGMLFKQSKLINLIARQSFYVYLIHMPIVVKLHPVITDILTHHQGTVIPKILCATIIFVMCTILVLLVKMIFRLFKGLLDRINIKKLIKVS